MSKQENISITGENDLTWRPVQVRLGDLDGWEGNPKRLTKAQAQRLLKSTQKLGQLQTIAVSPPKPNGRRDIYDGHQRNNVWQKAYHPDLVVWAMESSRFLTEQERKDIAMLTMTARGSFDWDILSGWDDLLDYIDKNLLAECKEDFMEIRSLLNFLEWESTEKEGKNQELPTEYYGIVIDCENEIHQAELLERFTEEGLKCRALVS